MRLVKTTSSFGKKLTLRIFPLREKLQKNALMLSSIWPHCSPSSKNLIPDGRQLNLIWWRRPIKWCIAWTCFSNASRRKPGRSKSSCKKFVITRISQQKLIRQSTQTRLTVKNQKTISSKSFTLNLDWSMNVLLLKVRMRKSKWRKRLKTLGIRLLPTNRLKPRMSS